MSKLTSKERNDLAEKDFALSGRRYPIENEAHARAALSRAEQYGTMEEKAEVRAAVHRKYPHIA